MKASFNRIEGNDVDKSRFEAAFGANANKVEVGKTIDKLQSDTFKVQLKANPGRKSAGYVKIEGDAPPEPGRFTGIFHGLSVLLTVPFMCDLLLTGMDTAARAGTLIHEGSHYIARTGDLVKEGGTKISTSSEDRVTGEDGCK